MNTYNDKNLKKLRRKLRNNATEAEVFLWQYLRKRRLCGYKFVRQYSVYNFILDFYCPKKKLGIELDGRHHCEIDQLEYDTMRTKILKERGIKIIRFWNNEVFSQTDSVLETIISNLKEKHDGHTPT